MSANTTASAATAVSAEGRNEEVFRPFCVRAWSSNDDTMLRDHSGFFLFLTLSEF